MFKNIEKRLAAAFVIGAVILAGMAIYGDFSKVEKALFDFNWISLLPALTLVLINYWLRFVRWNYYLNILDINLPYGKSLVVFLGGFLMSVTPGKTGELFKSYLIKNITGDSMSKTFPVILTERITDFLGMVVLAVLGASAFPHYTRHLTIMAIFIVVLIVVLGSSRIMFFVTSQLESRRFTKKPGHIFRTMYESTAQLIRFDRLVIATALSAGSWVCECLALYIIVIGLSGSISPAKSIFTYSFSSVAGALTMLPGGLGATEVIMTGLLIFSGVGKIAAISSTILVRICTLWFAILLGVISFFGWGRKYVGEAKSTDT